MLLERDTILSFNGVDPKLRQEDTKSCQIYFFGSVGDWMVG